MPNPTRVLDIINIRRILLMFITKQRGWKSIFLRCRHLGYGNLLQYNIISVKCTPKVVSWLCRNRRHILKALQCIHCKLEYAPPLVHWHGWREPLVYFTLACTILKLCGHYPTLTHFSAEHWYRYWHMFYIRLVTSIIWWAYTEG